MAEPSWNQRPRSAPVARPGDQVERDDDRHERQPGGRRALIGGWRQLGAGQLVAIAIGQGQRPGRAIAIGRRPSTGSACRPRCSRSTWWAMPCEASTSDQASISSTLPVERRGASGGPGSDSAMVLRPAPPARAPGRPTAVAAGWPRPAPRRSARSPSGAGRAARARPVADPAAGRPARGTPGAARPPAARSPWPAPAPIPAARTSPAAARPAAGPSSLSATTASWPWACGCAWSPSPSGSARGRRSSSNQGTSAALPASPGGKLARSTPGFSCSTSACRAPSCAGVARSSLLSSSRSAVVTWARASGWRSSSIGAGLGVHHRHHPAGDHGAAALIGAGGQPLQQRLGLGDARGLQQDDVGARAGADLVERLPQLVHGAHLVADAAAGQFHHVAGPGLQQAGVDVDPSKFVDDHRQPPVVLDPQHPVQQGGLPRAQKAGDDDQGGGCGGHRGCGACGTFRSLRLRVPLTGTTQPVCQPDGGVAILALAIALAQAGFAAGAERGRCGTL